jgi:hypothetical protein
MTTDNELNELYTKFWELTSDLLPEYSPVAIAGVMVAQALTIYKTVLTEEGFDGMVDSISDSRKNVKKLDIPVLQ